MIRSRVLLITVFVLAFVATTWSAAGTMSVQLKSGQLRSTPSFLGPVVALVSYGDQVEVLQQQGDWLQVKSPSGQQGWIHQSALTAKRVVFDTGGRDAKVAASGQEVALAGKGFNADVEAKYKADHREMDYTWVDTMEGFKVSPQEMITFLNTGDIRPREGGAK